MTKLFCSSLFFCCSEGVFKCPEDQLPLDYAKVHFTPSNKMLNAVKLKKTNKK